MVSTKYLKKLLKLGVQLSAEATKVLDSIDNPGEVIETIIKENPNKPIISAEDISRYLNENEKSTSILEPSETLVDKSKNEQIAISSSVKRTNQITSVRQDKYSRDIEVLFSPTVTTAQTNEEGFRKYFMSRYRKIQQIFLKRKDLSNLQTCNDLGSNQVKNNISLIAIVFSKQTTKKGSVILELEDPTGNVKAIIPSNNRNLVQKAAYILNDTVLYFNGSWQKGILYVQDIQWPDIPFNHKPHHSYEDVFALFISDLHVGSKEFSSKLLNKATKFLNGELESDKYNNIGKQVKYLFIAGDLVDGVGVYPDQIKDLVLDNIQFQYLLVTEHIEKIRSDIEIVIIPGNHDSARAAEPQTPIPKEFVEELDKLDNVHLLGSPAYLKVHNVEILMNHGNSIFDISAAITPIPHESTTLPMIEMLRNRHLVPIYGKKTPIAPATEDCLVINRIPDIFHVGHTHIAEDGEYKGVTLISSGSFQYQTNYQKRMNITPNPGVGYIVNFHSLMRSKIDFSSI
ncbi:MAG: metallophosphoesterase [Candidatus Heimdallarchaeaceae archaeon]